jgi:hypothetical protein
MRPITRRNFFKLCGISSIGMALAACGVSHVPTAIPSPTQEDTRDMNLSSTAQATKDAFEKLEIPKHYEKINATASLFIKVFGPAFTNTPEGHIETDIAGAATISGLMLLRASGMDLTKYKPGTIILSEIHQAQNLVFAFMMNVAYSMGLNFQDGWSTSIPKEHVPLFDALELSKKLESTFYENCLTANIEKDYYPYIAALTAMKLVAAGSKMNLLNLNIGKGLATYYVVAGSKTVPYPLATK